MSNYTINVTGMYLSEDGVAYEEAWPGLWASDYGVSVPGPRDPEGSHALDIYRFRDGEVIWGDVSYPSDENERFGFGCFTVDGCPALMDRTLSTVSLPVEQAGRLAVQTIEEIRNGNAPTVTILDVALTLRRSCGCHREHT